MLLLQFFSTIFPHALEPDEFLLLVIKDRASGQIAELLVRNPRELALFAEELKSDPNFEAYFGLATWRGVMPYRAMSAWVGQPSSYTVTDGISSVVQILRLEYPRGTLCCFPLPEPVRCDSRLRSMNRMLVERYGGIPEFGDMRAVAKVPEGRV